MRTLSRALARYNKKTSSFKIPYARHYNSRFVYLIFFTPNFTVVKGAFNNYVDKMRGKGFKKCLFLSTLMV
jgi:hypothetical protein